MFTDPEIATAGMMEHEAKEEGYDVKVGKMPFAALGRALTTGDTDGFSRSSSTQRMTACSALPSADPHASDLIPSVRWPWRWTQRPWTLDSPSTLTPPWERA